MDNKFFEHPILNSPYAYPSRHWELDNQGQPTQNIIEKRRRAEFITPIPKPRKRKGSAEQQQLIFDEGKGLPLVKAYVKNHNLGLEVPYRYGSEMRRYIPDFIVLVDDGRGEDDLLQLIVEIKGYRREDAKEKKSTMETYWVPGVNNLGTYGRWAFAEFTEVYQIETDFAKKVEAKFNKMVEGIVKGKG